MGVDLPFLRSALLCLPGLTEGLAYGSPIFRVGKKMVARLREDGVFVLKVDHPTRDMLLDTEPQAFFLEDHYRSHPLVCVDLQTVDLERLVRLLEAAWRSVAPKRLISGYTGT